MFNSGINPQEAFELQKAIEAGNIRGGAATSANTGAALKVEQLDRTLKILTEQERHMRIWNVFNDKGLVKPTYNTVDEFNQKTSVGDRANNVFFSEGGVPLNSDPSYVRNGELIGYAGSLRQVTYVASMVNMTDDPVAEQVRSGTIHVLRGVNHAMYFGRRDVNQMSFNGFIPQLERFLGGFTASQSESQSFLDARGQNMTQTLISDAATVVEDNFGYANCCFLSNRQMKLYQDSLFTTQRTMLSNSGENNTATTVGSHIQRQISPAGFEVMFYPDLFFKLDGSTAHYGAALNRTFTAPTIDTSTGAPAIPAAPTLAVAAVAATAPNSKHTLTTNNSYRYAVTSINSSGESAFNSTAVAAVSVVANGAAALTITGVPAGADGVIVYRSQSGDSGAAAKMYPIMFLSKADVAAGLNGGAATVVRDLNVNLPNTEFAIVADCSPEVWGFRQLGTLLKYPLATIATAERFIMMLMGTPQLFAPRKICVIRNLSPTKA